MQLADSKKSKNRRDRSPAPAAPPSAETPPVRPDAIRYRNVEQDGIDDNLESLEAQADDTARETLAGEPESAGLRRRMIAEAAYYKARQRDFAPGDPDADWLEAEREIDAELARIAAL